MDNSLFVKTMLDYIENRVAEEISADEIAGTAGFSLAHFRAVFRDATGQTLARYIAHRRLCHAASELVHTKRPVSDIAMTYYFGSHDVFIRAFKRAFGMTPSEFRQSRHPVSHRLIVPGIYGPSVSSEESVVMNIDNVSENKKDYGMLYGVVPRVSYFGQEAELTPFVSCLRACLTYMGQDISYARLMAGSGAAFRLMWNTKFWDGGNVDIMNIKEDPTEPLRRALKTAGREFVMLCKPGKEGRYVFENSPAKMSNIKAGEKASFAELIRNEIDCGRPLIGFGIIGPPEACIIAGYKEAGETLTGWNFFQDMPEFSAGIGKEPCGYYNRKGWYEYPETIALLAIGESLELPEEKSFLMDTLEYALSIIETPRVNDHAGGYEAYEAWAAALSKESEFPRDAPLPMLMERLMCQCDAMTMVGEGRWYASAFLEQEAGMFPEASSELNAAAQLYKQEHQLSMEMGRLLEGFAMSEKCAGALAVPETRKSIAALVRQCAVLEKKAAEHIRSAVNILK
ncbi:MAG TPA: helix-turn-helix transcriptional regulator [Clostridia bacterium]|nr:helix-turn-helix transcriptional regulator [Clostridia bacterium]